MTRRPKFSGVTPRRLETRKVRRRFLIVCEGQRTEPLYFESFRTPTRILRIEHGNSDPVRLVNRAIDARDRATADGDPFDRVWCVFDRDNVPPQRFTEALRLVRRERLQAAYSNPAFELWLLLHFEECAGCLSPRDYSDRLSRHLSRPYKKNDAHLPALLVESTSQAIDRATRLLAAYVPSRPAEDDPSTTVHLLVQELLGRD